MPLTDSLVAWWKLDETSGDRADSSGNGHTLTDINTVGSTTGKIGNAADFTAASSEELRNDSIFDLQSAAAASFSIWAGTTATSGTVAALGEVTRWAANAPQIRIAVHQHSSSGWYRASISGVSIFGQTGNLDTISKVDHVVARYDGGGSGNADRLKIYVNGVEASLSFTGTIPATMNALGSNTALGALYLGGSHFDGWLDLAGIWTKALSIEEIAELYNSGNGFDYPFSSGHPLALRGQNVPYMLGHSWNVRR